MNENMDVLLKLFDVLKEATDKNEHAVQRLITQQHDLVDHIRHLPVEDLQLALKDHQKISSGEMDVCTETIETTSSDLMSELRKVTSRVNKMILVVSVAFSLMAGTYILVRSVSDSDKKFDKWEKKIEAQQKEERRAITDEVIKQLRDEIRKLNNENSNTRR